MKRDNALFKSEFPTDMSSPQPPTPKSPGKRKFDERSDTSDDLPGLMRASPDRNRNLVTVSENEIDEEDELFPDVSTTFVPSWALLGLVRTGIHLSTSTNITLLSTITNSSLPRR